MTEIYVVGGTFDVNGGRPSSITQQLIHHFGGEGMNGGYIQDLLDFDPAQDDAVLWMPNVANTEKKVLPTLKKMNPRLLLITSKRMDDRDFTPNDFVGHMLKNKANLGIGIDVVTAWQDQDISGKVRFSFRAMDPLGNQYYHGTNVGEMALHLADRVDALLKVRRVPSRWDERMDELLTPMTTSQDAFLAWVRSFGKRFARFVNAVNPNRLLGNAATRCMYGFPAARDTAGEGTIFVSKRNVDKESLTWKDFVPVHWDGDAVAYGGPHKPSVDSPIQLQLFEKLPNINYMIHGHCYVVGGVVTQNKLPCGAVGEAQEVINALIDDRTGGVRSPKDINFFKVNLKGHGCLIGVQYLEQFNHITLTARPFPEEP
jgi:hypothetical protein